MQVCESQNCAALELALELNEVIGAVEEETSKVARRDIRIKLFFYYYYYYFGCIVCNYAFKLFRLLNFLTSFWTFQPFS